jgi:hypothetical protein
MNQKKKLGNLNRFRQLLSDPHQKLTQIANGRMRRISVKPKICTHQNVWTAFQITNVRLQKDEKPTKKEKKNSLPQRAER